MSENAENSSFELTPEQMKAVIGHHDAELGVIVSQIVNGVRNAGGMPPDVLVLLSSVIACVIASICVETEESQTAMLNVVMGGVEARLVAMREKLSQLAKAEQNHAVPE